VNMGQILQDSAAQLFRLHGYQVTLSRPTDSNGATYDPATGGMVNPETPKPLTWNGVGFFTSYRVDDIGDTSIKTDDRKLLLQAKGLVRPPEINDLVDSEVTILNVEKVRSGATTTHYVCQTRG